MIVKKLFRFPVIDTKDYKIVLNDTKTQTRAIQIT